MAKPEPNPCPCCGSQVIVTFGRGPAGSYANIRCDCGMQTKPFVGSEREAAKQACDVWNARTEEQ